VRVFLLSSPPNENLTYALRKRDMNYLSNVLRLKDGDVFTAKDKDGAYYKATISDGYALLERLDGFLETTDHLSAYDGRKVEVTVLQCILKGKKNEKVARELVEAGVKRLRFIASRYTEEKDFSAHERERIEAIMREAVQQSGSDSETEIGAVLCMEDIPKVSSGRLLVLHQSMREKTKTLKEALEEAKPEEEMTLVVGCEGGLSDEECAFLEENGGECVLLQTNILRAETAGIYALGAIQTFLNT